MNPIMPSFVSLYTCIFVVWLAEYSMYSPCNNQSTSFEESCEEEDVWLIPQLSCLWEWSWSHRQIVCPLLFLFFCNYLIALVMMYLYIKLSICVPRLISGQGFYALISSEIISEFPGVTASHQNLGHALKLSRSRRSLCLSTQFLSTQIWHHQRAADFSSTHSTKNKFKFDLHTDKQKMAEWQWYIHMLIFLFFISQRVS